jgi:simple sugar transport system permease protein
MELSVTPFMASAVRVATPLLLAALGETVAERGGVINLGIEGAMLAGALGATLGASTAGPWAGVAAAIAAGAVVGALFALVTVAAGAEQIIAGTATTLGAVGLTGVIYRQHYGPGGVGLTLPTFPAAAVPGLSALPVIGPLFAQSILTYAAILLAPVLYWLLWYTRWGLRLRAAGEAATQARARGVGVKRIRAEGVILGAALAGLAGASLVLGQVGTFAERMTAGRGFIAIAIVALGGWNPLKVLPAALFFGAALALQYVLQSSVPAVPYQLVLILPYLLTLLVLTTAAGRTKAPADLGRSTGAVPG